MPAPPETVAPRLDWPDFARGASIVMVVLLHLFLLHYLYFFYGFPGSDVVNAVVDATLPLRMPLFFLVSGYLAARAVQRPWRAVLRPRVLLLVYLYLVWVVVNAVFDVLREQFGQGGPVDVPRFLLDNLLWPQTTLWYLYALLLFFVVARLTRWVPVLPLVVAAAVLSVVGTTFFDGLPQHLLRSLVFYLLAARAPQLIDLLVRRSGWAVTTVTGVLAVGLTALYVATFADLGLLLAAGVASVAFAVQVSVRVAAHPLAAPVRYLGRHTLAIFLVHPFVFILANDLLLARPGVAEWMRDHDLVVIAYPWVLLAATLAACVGVEAVARRVGLGWFFALPSRTGTAGAAGSPGAVTDGPGSPR
ncbi:acyltransferase family protein [Herbiconiux sp. CPCC 205716]|uniref:Acyltransferase family protein n=1 Tax=Herbiconiux gentiana TaxID=2970912 RepID=A0ABT2GC84_9MICO|nr:acyltransferase family protein [Herbiconiux gentiana]MCS5713827.1 acyltransferase family protein [Herbiconiux gentiana]